MALLVNKWLRLWQRGHELLAKQHMLFLQRGIAGPGGGTQEKPVGLVWFGVTGPHGTVAHKANLIGNREDIRQSAAELALYYVYTYITEKEK